MTALLPVVAALPPALLLLAAWRDLATRTIPDRLSLAVLALGLALRAPSGAMALAASVGMAVLIFLVLVPAHARGLLGGGDIKLLAAVAGGLPPFATLDFLLATAIAGGGLGLAYLALGKVLGRLRPLAGAGASLLARVWAVERRRIRRGGPLPYAVAIAVGGFCALLVPGN